MSWRPTMHAPRWPTSCVASSTASARKYNAPAVVEKTCATSLRVEFTRRIFPEAKYLFITRDGVDAAASAVDRWHAPFDLGYTAAKARFVPPSDVPFYGARFVANQVRRRAASSSSATTRTQTWWGPKPHDYRELMEKHPLDELAMLQWKRCVQRSAEGLVGADVLHLRYEEFVQEPAAQLTSYPQLPRTRASRRWVRCGEGFPSERGQRTPTAGRSSSRPLGATWRTGDARAWLCLIAG